MEHGKVTSVKHQDGIVYCNVNPVRESVHYEAIPMMKSHSGFIQVPKEGQVVTMEKLNDGTRFISNVVAKEDKTPDDLNEGDLTIQLDADTLLSFIRTEKEGYDVELSSSGDMKFESSGRIDLNAPDGVYINGTKQ